ncbi:MAG: type II secretion system protein GspF [Bdellovibrionales bacterium GWC1_52_8]|nr:MAG: type II secretion system protein GspF [Bdellovibrionales bacterium GWB1_52_6]OFZ06077.1 MAG: type II secretion system protein GspF [Bdellovibrionales bacterium GWA1_52_35]OFZ34166.1 MAG: type II secretion system protein GspF [Bdellovibrionales bacterium GWC1_52_8]
MAPIFDFRAYSAEGKPQKGIIEAENQKSARQKLKKRGLMVTEIVEKNAAKPSSSQGVPFFGNRVSVQEVSLMTRQLASLVKANIPLVEALNALVEQTENERLKVVLAQVRQDVNEGSSLARATGAHPKVFDNIFINMIEAGESSGTLGLVLMRLAELKEAQMRLRSKVVSGMTYPILMMSVAMILMIVIFTFVIPKLTQVFESMNRPLPPVTKGLIFISDIVVNWWPLIIMAVAFGVWSFRRYINSAVGRPKWDAFKLRMPVFGSLVRMIAVTRFSSTMATLLGSGVPILPAMNIARNLIDCAPIAKAVAEARENITEGQSIAEPLRRSGEFPPMVIHMIAIGEKTGELPDMLKNVSSTYEDQINSKIESLTSLLEPIMIIAMGGVVGFIVISVIMPLLQMTNINQR